MINWDEPIQIYKNRPFYNEFRECHYLGKIHQNKRKLNLVKISLKDKFRIEKPITPLQNAAHEDVLIFCNDDGIDVRTGLKVVENAPKDKWVVYLVDVNKDGDHSIVAVPKEFRYLVDVIEFSNKEYQNYKVIGFSIEQMVNLLNLILKGHNNMPKFVVYNPENKSDFDIIDTISYVEAKQHAENYNRKLIGITDFENNFQCFLYNKNDKDLMKNTFNDICSYVCEDGHILINGNMTGEEINILKTNDIQFEYLSKLEFVEKVNKEQRLNNEN